VKSQLLCPDCGKETRITHTYGVEGAVRTQDRVCLGCYKQFTTVCAPSSYFDLPPGSAYKLAKYLRNQLDSKNDVGSVGGVADG
jgi:hypothetical protein